MQRSFHPAAVSVPPIMAIFILIIAAFNFMNSAISFAGKRLKEIGLRKVFGGQRKHIIVQFLGENFLISFIAVIVGIFLAGFLVPEYSAMWEYMDLKYNFLSNPDLILFILVLWIFTALLAGSYPAFYVSRFNPIKIFRDNLKIKGRNGLSRFLLGFQFFTSVTALFMGIMFAQNAVFQEKMDYGYDKDNIIVVGLNNPSDYKPFEQVIKTYPKVEKYAGTSYHIGYGNYNRSINYLDNKVETAVMHIGYDYLQTMGLTLKLGRLFNIENQASDVAENSIVVNEKFMHDFGFEEPVGKTVYVDDTTALHIIGVVNDVYLYGTWSDIDPLIYRLAPETDYRTFAIRASKENMNDVNEYLRTQWAELIPNYPYEGQYQVELMNEAKVVNKNIKVMFVFLAICALFLSALGLYTLVSLNVLNRTKEIGVRKVNGASVAKIMLIITRPFAILILITSVLGCVAGKYATYAIMESVWDVFTKSNLLSYLLPVLIILVTAAVTIIWKVYKAASVNPTVSLRYE
ncbi:MAG TPA: FtsX-like permease family protein [Bacteroidales bacterium]|nr:FtsX-like permease family protein [Bacteroidales bacterium]